MSFDFTVTHPERDFPDIIRLKLVQTASIRPRRTNLENDGKIRPPHGLLNPGGFDYQAWLFANGIGAVGYVRDKPAPAVAVIHGANRPIFFPLAADYLRTHG